MSTQWHKERIPVLLPCLYFIPSILLLPEGTEDHTGMETMHSCIVSFQHNFDYL